MSRCESVHHGGEMAIVITLSSVVLIRCAGGVRTVSNLPIGLHFGTFGDQRFY